MPNAGYVPSLTSLKVESHKIWDQSIWESDQKPEPAHAQLKDLRDGGAPRCFFEPVSVMPPDRLKSDELYYPQSLQKPGDVQVDEERLAHVRRCERMMQDLACLKRDLYELDRPQFPEASSLTPSTSATSSQISLSLHPSREDLAFRFPPPPGLSACVEAKGTLVGMSRGNVPVPGYLRQHFRVEKDPSSRECGRSCDVEPSQQIKSMHDKPSFRQSGHEFNDEPPHRICGNCHTKSQFRTRVEDEPSTQEYRCRVNGERLQQINLLNRPVMPCAGAGKTATALRQQHFSPPDDGFARGLVSDSYFSAVEADVRRLSSQMARPFGRQSNGGHAPDREAISLRASSFEVSVEAHLPAHANWQEPLSSMVPVHGGSEQSLLQYPHVDPTADGSLLSTGGLRHDIGECKPCIFAYEGRCNKGTNCLFCHEQHDAERMREVPLSKKVRERIRRQRQNDIKMTSTQRVGWK